MKPAGATVNLMKGAAEAAGIEDGPIMSTVAAARIFEVALSAEHEVADRRRRQAVGHLIDVTHA